MSKMEYSAKENIAINKIKKKKNFGNKSRRK